MIRTIRCKLRIEPAAEEILNETDEIFASACNDILKVALEKNEIGVIALHNLTYYAIREKYPLTANLTARAIGRVSQTLAALKRKRKKPKLFRTGSIDYDARIFTFFEQEELVSLSSVKGRIKAALDIGEYQRSALKGKKPTCATLVKRLEGGAAVNRPELTMNLCVH